MTSNQARATTPTYPGDVDQNELNNIIDTLLEARQNIRHDQPEFGIKPVNLAEK